MSTNRALKNRVDKINKLQENSKKCRLSSAAKIPTDNFGPHQMHNFDEMLHRAAKRLCKNVMMEIKDA